MKEQHRRKRQRYAAKSALLEWTTYSAAGTVKGLKKYENNFTAWAGTEPPRLEESN
jgi:hypothetical protein